MASTESSNIHFIRFHEVSKMVKKKLFFLDLKIYSANSYILYNNKKAKHPYDI